MHKNSGSKLKRGLGSQEIQFNFSEFSLQDTGESLWNTAQFQNKQYQANCKTKFDVFKSDTEMNVKGLVLLLHFFIRMLWTVELVTRHTIV